MAKKEKQKIKRAISLAQKGKFIPTNEEEKTWAKIFKGKSNSDLKKMSRNIRVQYGLKDRYYQGLIRSYQYMPYIRKILKDLNRSSIKSDIFTDISPNPIDDEIYKGRSFYKEGKHDSIIAIGGGSGMDGGKAISLSLIHI